MRLHFFEAWQRFICRVTCKSQSITNRCAENVFNRAHQPAYFTTAQNITINTFRRENAQTVSVVHLAGAHNFNFVALSHGAIFDTHQGDNTKVVIEPGVNDQRLQWCFWITFRAWDVAHQTFKNIRYTKTSFS
ncbi:hypothetical protein D3C75_842600 [compost metagenome]